MNAVDGTPFHKALGLLAADPKVLVEKLHPLRENASMPLLLPDNCLRLLTLLTESCGIYEGSDGSELPEAWSQRTGLPLSFLSGEAEFDKEPLKHLGTICVLIQRSDRYFLHTAHGVRSSREWSLVRFLARLTLARNNLEIPSDLPIVQELWSQLGGGILEAPEPYERFEQLYNQLDSG